MFCICLGQPWLEPAAAVPYSSQLLLLLLLLLVAVAVILPCCLADFIEVLLTGSQPACLIKHWAHIAHTCERGCLWRGKGGGELISRA
jgi:hypothetical protein